MKITVPFLYEAQIIKPHCRKYRPVVIRDEVEVEIKEMRKSEFPVAMKVGSENYHWDGEKIWIFYYNTEYGKNKETVSSATLKENTENCGSHHNSIRQGARAPFKNFWTNMYKWNYADPDFTPERIYNAWIDDCFVLNVGELEVRKWGSDNREEVVARANDIAEGLRIHNGKVYRTAGEPYYCITTFGLGNNHGGTGLFIETSINQTEREHFEFSALEYDKALQYAKSVAGDRGDTESTLLKTNCGNKIRVFIPEAVKFRRGGVEEESLTN